MSIWCSGESIGEDDNEVRDGSVRSYVNGWSNLYPDQATEYAAIDVSHTPAWCVPGRHETDADNWDGVGEWLRLLLVMRDVDVYDPCGKTNIGPDDSHAVYIREDAVRALHADLSEWLTRPKVRPATLDKPENEVS